MQKTTEFEEQIIKDIAYYWRIKKDLKYHSWAHTLRVVSFAKEILANEFNKYDFQNKTLLNDIIISSYLHDVGRINDSVDREHGYRSLMILDACKKELSLEFNIESVRFAILNHSRREGEKDKLPLVSNFYINEQIDKRVAACLWDADRLDLLRIPFFRKVDKDFLNTEYAKKFANSREHLKFYEPYA